MTEITHAYPSEIVSAIAKIMGADLYVQKRGTNSFHGYKFATVGDLLDKLQPLMAENGLVVFQHEQEREFIDNGSVLSIRYAFTLAHTSGAVWPDRPIHTGMTACRNSKGGFDDKAANKCHTAARKYFLLGLFQVPTGDDYREAAHDGDADSGDHAPAPKAADKPVVQQRQPTRSPAPQNGNPGVSIAERDECAKLLKLINGEIARCETPEDVDLVLTDNADDIERIRKTSDAGKTQLLNNAKKQKEFLAQKEAA